MNITEILNNYSLNGVCVSCSPLGEGHINDTMLIQTENPAGVKTKYVLQRINDSLFNADQLMHNVTAVTDFIRRKTAERGGDPDKECLTVIKTTDGKPYVKTADGCFRIYNFINGVSYQVVENPEDFKRCAYSFGNFTAMLSDFDATSLYEVIPHFHDTAKRFRDFTSSLKKNAAGKADTVQKEIDFVLKRKDYCTKITDLLKSGKIPTRVTHNDTKLNNVMFDKKTGKCLAVVDLDTVMPGSLCYDFGDAIRFGCNTSTEDDKDLSRVNFDINLFRAFADGYISALGDTITPLEKENLAFSAILLTYECGMRFLADHLDGDIYFHTSRENHNLDRARTQFKLIEDMERLLPDMEKIIREF